MQHRLAFGVAEDDVDQMNRRWLIAVRMNRARSCALGGHGQGREDALGAGQGSLDRLPLFAESRDRLEDALKENQERRQGAERDAEGFEHRSRSGPQESGHRQRCQDCGHRCVEGGEARGAVRCRQCTAEHLPEASDRFALPAECANDLDAPQALLEAGRERPDRDAGRAFGLADAYLQEAKRDHEWRRDQRGDERERGAEDEHPDREGQESHQVGHQDGDTRREHGVQSFDVRRAATDEVAHRRPVKAADGEPLNVREEANPQTAEHPLSDRRGEVAAPDAGVDRQLLRRAAPVRPEQSCVRSLVRSQRDGPQLTLRQSPFP